MTPPVKRAHALLCTPLLAVGLAACGNTVSTAGFTGEAHEVAQAISRVQTDATAGDKQKLCANDLASAVVARLNAARGGCQGVIKNQLAELDNFEVTVRSVQVTGTGAGATASASVKSIYAGKSRLRTFLLVKEGGKWKISGVG